MCKLTLLDQVHRAAPNKKKSCCLLSCPHTSMEYYLDNWDCSHSQQLHPQLHQNPCAYAGGCCCLLCFLFYPCFFPWFGHDSFLVHSLYHPNDVFSCDGGYNDHSPDLGFSFDGKHLDLWSTDYLCYSYCLFFLCAGFRKKKKRIETNLKIHFSIATAKRLYHCLFLCSMKVNTKDDILF